MVRSQIVVPVAVAVLFGGACHEEGSDERSALGAAAQGSATPCPVESVPRVRSNELRFNAGSGFPGRKQLELRFAADDSGTWRYGPSDTLIRAPGCYAFRVEGDDFDHIIAFRAKG